LILVKISDKMHIPKQQGNTRDEKVTFLQDTHHHFKLKKSFQSRKHVMTSTRGTMAK